MQVDALLHSLERTFAIQIQLSKVFLTNDSIGQTTTIYCLPTCPATSCIKLSMAVIHKENSDFVRISLSYIMLTSIITCVDAKVVFFLTLFLKNSISTYTALFLLVKLVQGFFAIWAAMHRKRDAMITLLALTLFEITALLLALIFVNFGQWWKPFFQESNVPERYTINMKTTSEIYLVYNMVAKVIVAVLGFWLSLDLDDEVPVTEASFHNLPDANLQQAVPSLPMTINIHAHPMKNKGAQSKLPSSSLVSSHLPSNASSKSPSHIPSHVSTKSPSEVPSQVVIKTPTLSKLQSSKATHIISNIATDPKAEDNSKSRHSSGPSEDSTRRTSAIFTNPYATGTFKFTPNLAESNSLK